MRETSSIIEPSPALAATVDEAVPRTGTATRIARSLRRDLLALASLVVVAIVVLAALLPEIVATHSPTALSMDRLEPPSAAHLFGTDQLGRDIFSRSIAGARVSIVVGLITALLAVSIGVPLGAIAGYTSPRAADNVIMRLMDVVMAFPPIILAITVIAALGTEPIQIGPFTLPHIAKLMFVIGILYAPQVARIVRSAERSAHPFR